MKNKLSKLAFVSLSMLSLVFLFSLRSEMSNDNFESSHLSNEFQKDYNLSGEAYNYLEEALIYMEKNSVNRKKINWNSLRAEVYRKASNALIPKDTYKAIELAISLLNDNHSFFLPPDRVSSLMNNDADQALDTIQSKSLLFDQQIGYLLVPPCYSMSENTLKEYSASLQQKIQALDQNNLIGWIVDLRGNWGGNMWPMVLGLRPLIGEAIFGFFSDGSGENSGWHFENQSVKNGNFEVCSLDVPSYQLHQPQPWIAVLIDNETCSSGEATTVAFLGRDKTKVFGQKTGGYTSANEMIQLSDGAGIFLASAYLVDRLGRVYVDGIDPDQLTETGDATLNEALQWLQMQNK